MSTAAQSVTLVLWAATPERPRDAATPLVYALAARALGAEVEVHYTGAAVEWLFPGVAARACCDAAGARTVLDLLRETRAHGVRHYACSMAVAERAAGRTLIAEGRRCRGRRYGDGTRARGPRPARVLRRPGASRTDDQPDDARPMCPELSIFRDASSL